MSFSNRILPILTAVTLGVIGGSYVFEPLLQQYYRDTDGTMRPEKLPASSSFSQTQIDSSSKSNSSSGKSGSWFGSSSSSSVSAPSLQDLVGGMVFEGEEASLVGITPAQDRALRQRLLAKNNAAHRAAEYAKLRAQTTGDGKIF